MNEHILNEIPPLSEKDCFHVIERFKTEFTFPLHQHKEFELNFIEHGAGLRRIVGDSMEYTEDYELILICGESLEHVWEQGNCNSKMMREITIQFSSRLFSDSLLEKNQFSSIRKMFKQAEHGICFPLSAIMKIYSQIDTIASERQGFTQFLKLLNLLNDLSKCEGARSLASSSFACAERNPESRRVRKVKEYINQHFNQDIRLSQLADIAGMTPVSFSRFFKLRTGKNLSDYIIDIRLGFASRMLVDSTKSISEICYECGFNNLSYYNRIFKKKKGMTPKVFRSYYRKNKLTI
ncbi:MAG: AraC family transcriptional regulator [Rikenellaceae bacterium]